MRDLAPGPVLRQEDTARVTGLRPGLPEPGPTGCQDPGGPARRPARAPDGGQVIHARGLGLAAERAQIAAAAGDVDLRAPAVPVGAHAAVLRALGGRARAQLRRQRRVRRLACARGGPASRPRQPWPPCWNVGTKPFRRQARCALHASYTCSSSRHRRDLPVCYAVAWTRAACEAQAARRPSACVCTPPGKNPVVHLCPSEQNDAAPPLCLLVTHAQ